MPHLPPLRQTLTACLFVLSGLLMPLLALSQDTGGTHPIKIKTSDGVTLFGEPYFGNLEGDAPLVLLFHQARSNGRGEYAGIARWLNASGYRAIAWDQRSGGDLYGSSNRTVLGLKETESSPYCDVYPDLQAALDYVIEEGLAERVIVWGSSYSGSLVFQLAAENPERIHAVLGFSPASGDIMATCRARLWIEKVKAPSYVFRPESEMERPTSVEQKDILTAAGADFLVVENGVHGSSMLVDERTGHDMSTIRDEIFRWLNLIDAK